MKELTKKQKEHCLKEMYHYYTNVKGGDFLLMCQLLTRILSHDLEICLNDYNQIPFIFPEFVRPYDATGYIVWWNSSNKNVRAQFCKKLFKTIQKS